MDYRLEVVVVPVSDVDRAKHFYAEQMGFPVDVDHAPNEQFRVVQMTPTGSGCSVTIGKGIAKMEPGSLNGLQLSVGDIEAAHAELSSRGVPVSTIQHHDGSGFVDGPGGDYNSFFFFQDPDGNGWAVQQSPLVLAAERAAAEAAAIG
ncbi:MAG TPA: VOC family protein [Candidatus Limnocylindrales bacterium]|nr:VOC family protein [Candidatus Limnocylindrales bacterium]